MAKRIAVRRAGRGGRRVTRAAGRRAPRVAESRARRAPQGQGCAGSGTTDPTAPRGETRSGRRRATSRGRTIGNGRSGRGRGRSVRRAGLRRYFYGRCGRAGLEIQAAFQRHVDNSVSKTINLPHAATPQDIAWIYDRAWELGLKGITIYRYGSKAAQVIEIGTGDRTNTSTGRRATRESAGSKAEPPSDGECESAT